MVHASPGRGMIGPHSKGRPDPRHASRRDAPLERSAEHVAHAAFRLQRKPVFVFHRPRLGRSTSANDPTAGTLAVAAYIDIGEPRTAHLACRSSKPMPAIRGPQMRATARHRTGTERCGLIGGWSAGPMGKVSSVVRHYPSPHKLQRRNGADAIHFRLGDPLDSVSPLRRGFHRVRHPLPT